MADYATTILIVDDNASNIYALESLLAYEKRSFIHATSGRQALSLVLKNNVDLIILDVQMPGMDGYEVAQILKSNLKTCDIPIIFASAEKKDRSAIMKGFEEGAIDYLSKPLDPDVTRAKVSVLLQLQSQRKELIEMNGSLKRAEAKIKESMLELEILNKELESFSYSVSHDLRAPLRSIIGYTEMLIEDFDNQLGEQGTKTLHNIKQNSLRMNNLIDDLLEFSRLGKNQLVKTRVDINALVHKVISEINQLIPNRAAFDISDLKPAFADSSLLTQVWMNFISNAIKYSAKKQSPKIIIRSTVEEKQIIYSISDNGAGFNMAYANKLFQVFQRLHARSEFEGTGVGLALARKIIIRHGGRVWAQGENDKGATFYFALPANLEENIVIGQKIIPLST